MTPQRASRHAVRSLSSAADYAACVALQRHTWGEDCSDIVPPATLKVAQKIGGVLAGAFDENGRLVGFVFGMVGVIDGRLIHWSDMLAVREEARDGGVGRVLKEFQREAARASGASEMYWTYDPLVARNAHLNFNRLGVRVSEYVEDMYGDSDSELHRGLGTDRLVVRWPLDGSARTPDVAAAVERGLSAPVADPRGDVRPTAVRIEIPSDILAVRERSPDDATRWRSSTRGAFQWALANGYDVTAFLPDAANHRGYYLLETR
jgi:predicted GNAT superfamily acetyltransferase